MVDVSEERFAELVEAAFNAVPTELAALLDNVVLFIEDDAPDVLIAGTGKFAQLHAAWRASLPRTPSLACAHSSSGATGGMCGFVPSSTAVA